MVQYTNHGEYATRLNTRFLFSSLKRVLIRFPVVIKSLTYCNELLYRSYFMKAEIFSKFRSSNLLFRWCMCNGAILIIVFQGGLFSLMQNTGLSPDWLHYSQYDNIENQENITFEYFPIFSDKVLFPLVRSFCHLRNIIVCFWTADRHDCFF